MRKFKVVLRASIIEFTTEVVAKSKVQAVLAASREARAEGLTDRTWKLIEVTEVEESNDDQG